MANTVMLGLSVPFAPVTWLFGPAAALNAAMTLGLAATALAWYWLIRRRLVRHRGAAAVGAALAAFAPPMVSHAHAHPNFMVLFMIPLIIDRALRLCEGTRVVRDGVVLGLFTTYQIFLGEEPLLLAAVGMLLFAAAYGLAHRDMARAALRPLARGLGVAVAVTVPLVAFPLHWQFFGPQSYTSVLHGDNAGNSPLALLSFAERSLAGNEKTAAALSANPTEQNAFYGWPLAALAFAIVVRLWEWTVVKALACTVLAAAFLSLGPKFRIPLTDIVLPGPWAPLSHLPLFESVIESRVAMVCAPALGMLVALALAGLFAAPHRMTAARCAGVAAVALALLPIVPAAAAGGGAGAASRVHRPRDLEEVPGRRRDPRARAFAGPGRGGGAALADHHAAWASACPAATSTGRGDRTAWASTARRPATPPTSCGTSARRAVPRGSRRRGAGPRARTWRTGKRASWCSRRRSTTPNCG